MNLITRTRAGLIGTAIVSLTLALVPAAAAARTRTVTCRPVDRSLTLALHARGLSCEKARRVERYADHNDVSVPFRADGRTWRAVVYSHAHHHTYLRARSGRRVIWIAWRHATPKGGEPHGGAGASGSLPASTRQVIFATAAAFLKEWETFPAGNSATAQQRIAYRARLIPFVDRSDLTAVSDRVDNHQPSFICPNVGCTTGSTFLPSVVDPVQAAQIRAYSNGTVYMTTSGAVRYFGSSNLNGVAYYRSYGLVLTQDGSGWLVTRAAADTSGPVR